MFSCFFSKKNYISCISLLKTTIVNLGEFGARSDGATPISNRRATSDDVPNFSSIDYTMLVYLSIHYQSKANKH
ncbi:palindromic element RPE2 domain-containing protein [Candidatus Tisiphia endosymbiont of Mystacides longicornis]|uniref:palindromic element RPE2 domain-containing protein n=1 Tax=Candidatus Tisiphia endosymbiont of Mystacides longicornis TaxID=3139330 RepID=UPI003CCA9D09